MSDKKIIFFDIDGTIRDFSGRISQSTKKSLDQLKDNGHKIFVCTGRTRCQIPQEVLQCGFDGIVAAAGAYVEYDNHVIDNKVVSYDNLNTLLDYSINERLDLILQGTYQMFALKESVDHIFRIMGENLKINVQKVESIIGNVTLIRDFSELLENENSYVSKAMFYNSRKSVTDLESDLGRWFDFTASSIERTDEVVGEDGVKVRLFSGEITMSGINKAYGMKTAIKALGLDQEDTVAFGDGPNDLDMLEYAGVGVAMGNACNGAKETADLITADIENDGIYQGLIKLGMI